MDNLGWLELLPQARPAAGQPVVYRIPGETYTAIKTVRATLVTSAVVANRFVGLEVQDGDQVPLFRVVSPTAVPATTTRRTFFSSDIGAIVTSTVGDEALPFSGTLFPPGFRISVFVSAIDPADQLSLVAVYVRRMPSSLWADSPGSSPYMP